MKKLVCALLAMLMVVALFAGCGKTETPTAELSEAERDAAVVFDNNSDTVDVADLKANNAAELAKIKVGFIFLHDENSTYDLNFMNAAIAACDELGVEYLLRTNIPEGPPPSWSTRAAPTSSPTPSAMRTT